MRKICPLCNSTDVQLLYKLSINQLIKEIVPESEQINEGELKKIINQLWGKNDASFLKCNQCKYGFSHPYIPGNAAFYSQLYYSHFNYPKTKWEYEKTLKCINDSEYQKELKLLEIGAGNGSFLDMVSEIGLLNKNIYSTEYSETACDSIIQKGYYSTNASFEDLIKNKKLPVFDIFCMFQVLEHLDNIEEVFTFLNKFSKVGTKLFVAVPNARLRNLLDKYSIHYDLPPTHVGKIPLETFQFLGNRYDWQIVEYEYEPATYQEKLKKLAFERYWKNENALKIEGLSNKLIKYLIRYLILLSIFIRYLKIFYKLRSKYYGTSFWIYLKKKSNN